MSAERDAHLAMIGAAVIEVLEKAGLSHVDIALVGAAMAGAMLGRCPAAAVQGSREGLISTLDRNEAHTRRMDEAYSRAGEAGVSPQAGWA